VWVPDAIEWSADGIDYIGSRSTRYRGAVDIEPGWTQEVLTDPDLIAFEPDPKSRMGASRFIGESPAAGTVLVVIGYRDLDGDLHGINPWPATGTDLDLYAAGASNGEDD
jgi:hypothetical protein